MKESDKNKPIQTIPTGVWECGIINDKKKTPKENQLNSITTDLQGNGYPIINDNQGN